MESPGTRKSSVVLSWCVDIPLLFHHILIFDSEFFTYITLYNVRPLEGNYFWEGFGINEVETSEKNGAENLFIIHIMFINQVIYTNCNSDLILEAFIHGQFNIP